MQNHQLCQALAVNEDYSLRNAVRVLLGSAAEPARGNEYSAVGLCAVKCSDKSLDVGAFHGTIRIPLGLDVDSVQAEHVLSNDTIDASVAWSPPVFRHASPTAITHRGEQF
jgi:hypothetical protein